MTFMKQNKTIIKTTILSKSSWFSTNVRSVTGIKRTEKKHLFLRWILWKINHEFKINIQSKII